MGASLLEPNNPMCRMDLTATDEVSELMNSAAYETYLKEECEDHWWKHIIAQIQIEVLNVAYEVLHEND